MNSEELLKKIDAAFSGVLLEDGIGLYEANGIDDRKSKSELAALRKTDEKHDWRVVTVYDLKKCWCSYNFLDAKGLRFYLPAMMSAEISGNEMAIPVSDRLTGSFAVERYKVLSKEQRMAVREFLIWALNEHNHPTEEDELQVLAEWLNE